ncbi:MAG: OmpA family protein [Ignavibacteria bacterium]|nr:OmpA family protein [Ignavibacteria bacterium]
MPEVENADRYILTYADLITLLLGLFIILYAISNIDIQKYEKMISAMGNTFGNADFNKAANQKITIPEQDNVTIIDPQEKLQERLQNVIEHQNYGEKVKLIENERGVTIRILDDILFQSGKADLGANSQKVLASLAEIIKTLPNDIRIEGHTDNVPVLGGQYASNWHLSVARATNTAYYLMTVQEVNPEKVSIVGYSSYKPIATNETNEGKALNRRVDIVILNK